MRRWLVNFLTTLSLLASVTSTVLWVRSYFVGDVLYAMVTPQASRAEATINFGSQRGRIYYLNTSYPYPADEGGWKWDVTQNLGPQAENYRFTPNALTNVTAPAGWKPLGDGSEPLTKLKNNKWANDFYKDPRHWVG